MLKRLRRQKTGQKTGQKTEQKFEQKFEQKSEQKYKSPNQILSKISNNKPVCRSVQLLRSFVEKFAFNSKSVCSLTKEISIYDLNKIRNLFIQL